jgi:transcriptional regulator with XRE-family HTH domain
VSDSSAVQVQRSFRGVLRAAAEEEGERLRTALLADLDASGLPDAEIADKVGIDRGQMSRIRQGKAHPPEALVVWAIEHGRLQYVRAVCAVAEGEFKPRPPPSPEERLQALEDELAAAGLAEHFRLRVARRLNGSP